MREISLKPYPGFIYLCETHDELREVYESIAGDDAVGAKYPYTDSPRGRYMRVKAGTPWLVWGEDYVALAHEFSHVLLLMFRDIGHDPTQGDGEPFCYMLSHLMNEARRK